MLKLLIKQGPFYITAFTAFFVALDNAGWLVNLKPKLEEVAAPLEETSLPDACFIEDGEEVCFSLMPMMLDLDFVEEQTGVEWWVALAVLIVGTIILGFIARKVWEFVFD